MQYIKGIPGGIPEWLKGADCKSASTAFGGSNPPPTTILKIKRTSKWCVFLFLKYVGGNGGAVNDAQASWSRATWFDIAERCALLRGLLCKQRTAAPRGQSLGKSADSGSVENSSSLLRRHLDLPATLPHDASAGWI